MIVKYSTSISYILFYNHVYTHSNIRTLVSVFYCSSENWNFSHIGVLKTCIEYGIATSTQLIGPHTEQYSNPNNSLKRTRYLVNFRQETNGFEGIVWSTQQISVFCFGRANKLFIKIMYHKEMFTLRWTQDIKPVFYRWMEGYLTKQLNKLL